MKRLEKWFQSLATARRFGQDVRPHVLELTGVALLSLFVAALDLLRPWPLKWIMDNALIPSEASAGGDSGTRGAGVIWWSVVAAAAIAIAYSICQYFREISVARVSQQVTRTMRYRIFSHLSNLSPIFHARHKSGDLLVRLMGDVPMVTTMMVDSSVEIVTRGILVVGTVGMMFVMDPLLTGMILASLPLMGLVIRALSGRIKVAVRKSRKKEGDLADYLHEAIAATETIQALGSAEHVVRRFAKNNRRSARAGLKARKLAARMSGTVESFLGIAMAGVLAFGSFRVLKGEITAGDLLIFVSYVRNLIKPLRSAAKHSARIAKGTACGERILAVLDAPIDVQSGEHAVSAPERPETLTFEDISFSYRKDSPALAGFSARFHRGEMAALVGRSGAGKSTAASLALRLFDPDEGRILLDDRPIEEYELSSLRGRIGLCLQRTMLFGESIRENLMLAQPEAEEAELWEALRMAGADEFIDRLPDGLDTELGSNGVGLSGGQQSRLSLARTLLRGARVLIVDEPFAGLDRQATERVGRSIRALAQDRIVIVIAHDLDNLDLYDRIVFMDGGKKVGEGSHGELMETIPLYRDVIRSAAGVAM